MLAPRQPMLVAAVDTAPQRAATWAELPTAKRALAERRLLLIRPLMDRISEGVSRSAAINHFLLSLKAGHTDEQTVELAIELGRNGKPVSRSTLQKYCKDFEELGIVGLAPQHKGSSRTAWGWEARFHFYYDRPTKPDLGAVSDWLQDDGFEDALYHRVRAYAKSLPATQGSHSPARVGPHFYNQNIRPHKLRSTDKLPVGMIYEGDGHTCDVYIAHPRTGKPWRPEFTPWVDVRSHYVVAWYISESESTHTTLFSLSAALTQHNHVPAAIHVDPGSGFKNKIIAAPDSMSFCSRYSIEFMSALPGNAKGKGLTEGWFHHFEDKVGRKFHTFMGGERTDRYLAHLSQKVKRGDITLPTLEEYIEAIRHYVDRYNNKKQQRLGCSPASLWATLERTPLETPEAAIIRPVEPRVVQRWRVALHNRSYEHAELAKFEKQTIQVEYDLHNASKVWCRTKKGQFICEAALVDRQDWISTSRIEDLQQKRLEGQIKRKQLAIKEDAQRSHLAITHEDTLQAVQEFEAPLEQNLLEQADNETGLSTPMPSPEHQPDEANELELNFTDFL